MLSKLMLRPRWLGAIAATAATGAGIAFMAFAGAPHAYLALNSAALAIGLALLAIVVRSRGDAEHGSSALVVVAASALLATALFGVRIEGAARWVRFGVVTLQPALILLPLMILAYARRRDRLGSIGMALAALALALQPDRAMAGALLAGTAAVALPAREPAPRIVLAVAALGFAVTLLRADTLPPTPFVEQVLASALALSAPAGAGMVAAAALLLLPALARDHTAPVFVAVWLAILVAATLGNHPTPLLGYGGSGILGYLLCLAALPGTARRAGRAAEATAASRDETGPDRFVMPLAAR